MKVISKLLGHPPEPQPVHSTRVVEGPQKDGSWGAELSKDGVPYAYVRVSSISDLIARSK